MSRPLLSTSRSIEPKRQMHVLNFSCRSHTKNTVRPGTTLTTRATDIARGPAVGYVTGRSEEDRRQCAKLRAYIYIISVVRRTRMFNNSGWSSGGRSRGMHKPCRASVLTRTVRRLRPLANAVCTGLVIHAGPPWFRRFRGHRTPGARPDTCTSNAESTQQNMQRAKRKTCMRHHNQGI